MFWSPYRVALTSLTAATNMIGPLAIGAAMSAGFSPVPVAVGVALTHWPSLARVLRAEVMQLREQPWLAAARASGASAWHIAWGHVLPALVPQLLVKPISEMDANLTNMVETA